MRRDWRTLMVLLLAACSSDPSPGAPSPGGPGPVVPGPVAPDPGDGALPQAGAIVSAAIPRSLLPAAMAGSGSLVFVSAAPGSFPGGMHAHVLGSRGDSAVALVRDGGFDPLPVEGTTGGRVTLSIVDSAGRQTTSSAKAGSAPPRVVRLSPAARRTDVPLNVRIVAVFSAPVDSAAAVAGVRLLQDGAVVPAQARLSPDRLEVALLPDAPLAANTTYEVTVAATVTDVFGTALGAPVSTSFTTGTSVASGQFLSISGYAHPWRNSWLNLYKLEAGDSVGLALRQYENGPQSAFSEGVPTTWSSSDPTVLQVVEQSPGYAIEVGLRPGRARLRAEALGVVVERDVEVVGGSSDAPSPDPGTLLVQVNVTGTAPDTAFLLRSSLLPSCGWPEEDGCGRGIPLLAGLNTFELHAGEYDLELWDLATHCVATDGLTRAVSLAPRQAASVTFSVDCGAATSTLRVSATVTGEFLPPLLEVVYSNANCLACLDSVVADRPSDISVAPGSQQVTLYVPDYCMVRGPNPVQATVSAGAVLDVGFAVLCTSWGFVDVTVAVQGANLDSSFFVEGSVVGSAYDGWPLGLDRQPFRENPTSLRLPAGRSYRFLLTDIAANCRVLGDNPATVEVASGFSTTPLHFSVTCE